MLGVCVGLVISYLIANEFYQIAIMKGFNESKYLWISFFLGVVGYLLVIALPDKSIKNEPRSSSASRLIFYMYVGNYFTARPIPREA